MIDSHAHIYDRAYDGSGGAHSIIESMARDGLEYIVCIGCDMPSSEASAALAKDNARVYAAVGVHPYDADTVTSQNLQRLRELSISRKVVAVGEIGLDYHYDGADRAAQLAALCAQYDLARELRLPQVYHVRDGFGDFCEFVKTREFPQSAVMHCFSGSAELAEMFVKRGMYVSFSGTVTYKNAANLRRAAQSVPLDRLLAETDSPYLSPEPFRGKLNYPKNVAAVCDVLAEIKGVTPERMRDITAQNAKAVFGIS